jgi:hypothetical protein
LAIAMATIGLAVLVFAAGCQQSTTVPTAPKTKRQIGTVALQVDFGGRGDNLNLEIPCSEDSTVMDILNRSAMHGDLKLDATGSGETAFLHAINGIGNAAQDREAGNFWTYTVNGQTAKTGGGVTQVAPGDLIQWRFGPADPDLFD